MENSKMNIYQKLIEVRKTAPYLKKDNAGYQFKYVSSSQTLGTLRGKMDDLGLLLIPRVLDADVQDHTTRKGDHEYFTILRMLFVWVNADNPDEKIECEWTGQGLDSGEKGVGKALTYAEKYFMLKFFNIATDQDDPDKFQKKFGNEGDDKKKPTTEERFSRAIDWIKSFAKNNCTLDDFDTAIASQSENLALFKGEYKKSISNLIEETRERIEEQQIEKVE